MYRKWCKISWNFKIFSESQDYLEISQGNSAWPKGLAVNPPTLLFVKPQWRPLEVLAWHGSRDQSLEWQFYWQLVYSDCEVPMSCSRFGCKLDSCIHKIWQCWTKGWIYTHPDYYFMAAIFFFDVDMNVKAGTSSNAEFMPLQTDTTFS